MIKLGDAGVSKLYLGNTEIKKAYLGDQIVLQSSNSRLPSGYTEVEYIQNSDTSSYINTKKSIKGSDFSIEISAPEWVEKSSTKYLFYSNYFSLYTNSSNLRLQSGTGTSDLANYSLGTMNTDKITVTGSMKSVSANGVDVTLSSNNYGLNMVFPYTSSSSSLIIRLYSYKGSKSGSTSQNYNFELVPCINPSGTVGLYDLVSGAFIGPTSGTFIAGPAV